MNDTLLTVDSKGKVRVVEIECNWNSQFQCYIISRVTGLYDGKKTLQPNIEITKGKAKRTITEQATLQYNALVKEYLDKGYINSKDIPGYGKPDFDIHSCGLVKTDQNGAKKVMLCKVIDFNDRKLLKIKWLVSRKHDGVRATLFLRDGEVHTASRGGQDYDIPASYIREDPTIKQILLDNPGTILDGEIYRHGWPLEKISGLCRQNELCEDHKELKFHCYDIMDEKTIFSERYKKQQSFVVPEDSRLSIVEQIEIGPFDDLDKFKEKVMELHDKFIEEGYEGAVIKAANEVYKCGARDRRCQKIKMMTTDEFKITGLSEGLREEDMAFELVTKEGYPFKAKPEGDRALKHWYHEHINELIGKMMTVRYFHMSNTEHPVPNLPVAVSIRDDKDMD